MPEAHLRRRDALRDMLRPLELDALLVVNPRNIRYLTGFTGSNAALLVDATGEDRAVFCTDGRYVTQSATEVPELERVIDRACDLTLAERAAKHGYQRLGFESQTVTVDQRHAL